MLPGLRDADEIRAYIAEHPVTGLSARDIYDELDHWRQQLEFWRDLEIQRAENKLRKSEAALIRWGGLSIAIGGIPACFAILPVGLAISIVGASITVYGEIKQDIERRRKAKLDEPIELALSRREALIDELRRRDTVGNVTPLQP
jgi:hypothetical protein